MCSASAFFTLWLWVLPSGISHIDRFDTGRDPATSRPAPTSSDTHLTSTPNSLLGLQLRQLPPDTSSPSLSSQSLAFLFGFDSEFLQEELKALSDNIWSLMEASAIKSGALVRLHELHPTSPFFKQGASLRIVGELSEYFAEKCLATVIDSNAILKVNTEFLRDITFRVGSVYQFIGELCIQPDNEGILEARVGRNIDGIDLNLYQQSLLLLRQFQADHLNNPNTLPEDVAQRSQS